jgi:hypothetical protein
MLTSTKGGTTLLPSWSRGSPLSLRQTRLMSPSRTMKPFSDLSCLEAPLWILVSWAFRAWTSQTLVILLLKRRSGRPLGTYLWIRRQFGWFHWSFLQVVLVLAFHAISAMDCRSFHHLNEALPKVDNPKALGDYHPISLIHNFGKIFSKIMANRFGPNLP